MRPPSPHALIAVDGLADEHVAEVADVLGGWATWERIGEKTAADVFAGKLERATIHLGWAKPAWLLPSAVALHQLPSVGYEGYVGNGLAQKAGYELCNARGVMGVAVAEHAVALMMALARRLPEHARDQAARRWQRRPPYREVTGATACVVGLGDIGTELARRCKGLGMDVVGVRGDAGKGHEVVQKVYGSDEIAEAVAGADHVFLALPETPATRGLFDGALLGRMKPGACLYNLARGPVVDEEALLEHLTSGHLGGAGLDVFTEEPLPPESPLWALENVIVTPHAAGRSVREHDRLVALFVENLHRHRDGAPLLNRVAL